MNYMCYTSFLSAYVALERVDVNMRGLAKDNGYHITDANEILGKSEGQTNLTATGVQTWAPLLRFSANDLIGADEDGITGFLWGFLDPYTYRPSIAVQIMEGVTPGNVYLEALSAEQDAQ